MPDGTPVDLGKLRSIGVISRRTRDQVVDGFRADGVRTKSVTDELGNTVTEHASKDDRVDVNIRAPRVAVTASVSEERD